MLDVSKEKHSLPHFRLYSVLPTALCESVVVTSDCPGGPGTCSPGKRGYNVVPQQW